jgi:hypothetical protein
MIGSGEHRLPAWSFRQLAEKSLYKFAIAFVSKDVSGRLPDTTGWQQLAACAPRNDHIFGGLFQIRDALRCSE